MAEKFGEKRDIEKESQGEGVFGASPKTKTPVLEKGVNDGQVEADKQKREIFNQKIEESMGEFDRGEKTAEDFHLMVDKIYFLKEDGFNLNRAWSQDQVDKLIDLFEKYGEDKNIYDPFFFSSIFTTNNKEKREKNTVSELAAKSLTKRLEDGQKLSPILQEQIRIWFQHIQMIDRDVMLDLVFAMLDNPGKVYKQTISEAIGCMGLYGGVVGDLREAARENSGDISKSIKIIRILDELKYKQDEVGFEETGIQAENILRELKKRNNNFFIKVKIDELSKTVNERRKKDGDFHDKFDDPLLKEKCKILSAEAEITHPDYVQFMKEASIYSRINDKYAVIYDTEYSADSFFTLKQEGKPQRLSIKEVLAKEGFRKENMGEEDYRKMILTYKSLIELPLRDRMEEYFGIKLKDFSIREQVQFVNFLSSKSIKEVEKVKEFLAKGADKEAINNRIKSFLSLESGEEMGKKILDIGENLDGESADLIFNKYGEIVDLAEKNREQLNGLFKENKDILPEEMELITQNLIKRANNLLVKFSEKIKDAGNKEKRLEKEEILPVLEKYKGDLVLTASVYKSLQESRGGVKLEDLKDVTFERAEPRQMVPLSLVKGIARKHARELIDKNKDISQMLGIYARNYEDKPALQKKLLEEFRKKFGTKGSDTVLYFYRKGEEIIAFDRFDRGKGKKYFASVNVRPELAGSAIGAALIETSLKAETVANETIEADCLPDTAISSHYIEKSGFVVKKVIPNYEGTGETVFNIERSPKNKSYRRSYEGNDLAFEFKRNSPELLKKLEELINEKGYVMTRYFFDKDSVYCALEK
ncbi:MAG: hypothetical protein AAB451_02600 [Patescibacteria group bacterium]